MTVFIRKLAGKVIGEKRRWRQYKARVRQLPPGYRAAVEAIQRHMMYFVPADGENDLSRFEDLAELFEQAVAQGTSIRDVVGENPVEFVDDFVRNYTVGGYIPVRARKRLTDAITRAEETR
jgi:DNA-binding ferritin-like protein (Dps family)